MKNGNKSLYNHKILSISQTYEFYAIIIIEKVGIHKMEYILKKNNRVIHM